MAYPKVKLSNDSGDEVGVTNNRLDVNAAITVASDTIDIGDVEVKGHAEIADGSNTDVGTSAEYLYGDSTSVACKHVDIMAAVANTGIIYVGATGVS